MTSQYETNLWSTHINIVRLAEPIRRCVRWRTQVFKIEGFVCKLSASVCFLPFPLPLFHFLALVSFLARSKPKVPCLGISLLRNQTETLATQARKGSPRLRIFGRILKRIYDLGSYSFFDYYQLQKKREDPKKDHLHDINGMSSCSSMRKIEGKNNKLIIAAKTSRKCNITTYGYTKCILFLFETQTFLEWNTP